MGHNSTVFNQVLHNREVTVYDSVVNRSRPHGVHVCAALFHQEAHHVKVATLSSPAERPVGQDSDPTPVVRLQQIEIAVARASQYDVVCFLFDPDEALTVCPESRVDFERKQSLLLPLHRRLVLRLLGRRRAGRGRRRVGRGRGCLARFNLCLAHIERCNAVALHLTLPL